MAGPHPTNQPITLQQLFGVGNDPSGIISMLAAADKGGRNNLQYIRANMGGYPTPELWAWYDQQVGGKNPQDVVNAKVAGEYQQALAAGLHTVTAPGDHASRDQSINPIAGTVNAPLSADVEYQKRLAALPPEVRAMTPDQQQQYGQLLHSGVSTAQAQSAALLVPAGNTTGGGDTTGGGGTLTNNSSGTSLDPLLNSPINAQSSPTAIAALQKFLISQGKAIPAIQTGTAQPGVFGAQTQAALTQWQQENGITTGAGIGTDWGPRSISAAVQGQTERIGGSTTGNTVIPPSTQPTGPSIGTYKGQPITGGTQEEIQAQMRAIDAANQPIISGSDTRSDTTTNSAATIPPETGITNETGNSGIRNLNEDQLALLYPILKPGSSEYQAAMDKISSAYFDVMQQQMNAQTEQDQQAAQYNWNQLKSYTEKNLNIKLADNALQAWDQIQGLNNQFNQQNTQGSGLQQEAMDSYLNRIRRTDSVNRTASQTDVDSKQQDYYRKFATPEEIRALDPQKAANWGLIPSGSMKQAMDPALLKQKYPEMSDKQIQAYIATVLDENGNFRSALYQKHMMGANVGTNNPNISTTRDADGNPISVDVTASDFGQMDIDRAREQNKQEQVQLQNLQMEQTKRKALGSDPKTENNYFDSPPPTGGIAAASAAAAALGSSSRNQSINPVSGTVNDPNDPAMVAYRKRLAAMGTSSS